MANDVADLFLAKHGVSMGESTQEPEADFTDVVYLDEFFAHYGVAGMRWGFRRSSKGKGGADGKENEFTPASSADAARVNAANKAKGSSRTAVTGTITKPDGTKERATGFLEKHPDGATFRKMTDHEYARYLSQKPKSQLSNTELKELTTRLELEKKYAGFFPSKKSKYVNTAKGILDVIKVTEGLLKYVPMMSAGKAGKATKAAAAAATVAAPIVNNIPKATPTYTYPKAPNVNVPSSHVQIVRGPGAGR